MLEIHLAYRYGFFKSKSNGKIRAQKGQNFFESLVKYRGGVMSDNSTGGWIGDRRDGGVGLYLSWSTDVRQLNRWLDW